LAAYEPVVPMLRERDVHVVIISTSSAAYISNFVQNLGFELPGVIAIDCERRTHAAAGLHSSVWASLVMPFKKHVATFGMRAVGEALRLSLVNATAGHGSSWQQGATFVLKHPKLGSVGDGGHSAVECTWAWREDFPGDWQPVHTILSEALSINDAPECCFSERLEFVINRRKGGETNGQA